MATLLVELLPIASRYMRVFEGGLLVEPEPVSTCGELFEDEFEPVASVFTVSVKSGMVICTPFASFIKM